MWLQCDTFIEASNPKSIVKRWEAQKSILSTIQFIIWFAPTKCKDLATQGPESFWQMEKKLRILCFHALLWSIWMERNKRLFYEFFLNFFLGFWLYLRLFVGNFHFLGKRFCLVKDILPILLNSQYALTKMHHDVHVLSFQFNFILLIKRQIQKTGLSIVRRGISFNMPT